MEAKEVVRVAKEAERRSDAAITEQKLRSSERIRKAQEERKTALAEAKADEARARANMPAAAQAAEDSLRQGDADKVKKEAEGRLQAKQDDKAKLDAEVPLLEKKVEDAEKSGDATALKQAKSALNSTQTQVKEDEAEIRQDKAGVREASKLAKSASGQAREDRKKVDKAQSELDHISAALARMKSEKNAEIMQYKTRTAEYEKRGQKKLDHATYALRHVRKDGTKAADEARHIMKTTTPIEAINDAKLEVKELSDGIEEAQERVLERQKDLSTLALDSKRQIRIIEEKWERRMGVKKEQFRRKKAQLIHLRQRLRAQEAAGVVP